jgi:hypothetical protein
MDRNSVLIMGSWPPPNRLVLTVRMNDCGAQGFIGELMDPDTRTLVAGGPLPTVEAWLVCYNYSLVPKSRGVWEQGRTNHRVRNV